MNEAKPQRYAKRSILSGSLDPYECKHGWPEDCYVQCGDSGVVLRGEDSYTTAFFEAFPRDPDTFIRGEGETIEDAEEDAWEKFRVRSQCDHPDYERRGYRNGLGFCVECGLSRASYFDPLETCHECGEPTYYASIWSPEGEEKVWYCEEHLKDHPCYSLHQARWSFASLEDEDYDKSRVYCNKGPKVYKEKFGEKPDNFEPVTENFYEKIDPKSATKL